jgi:Flp pilus assembly protein TadD
MAARRLLIVMVVLLVLSSVAAALVPPPGERSTDEAEETTTQKRPAKAGTRGELVEATVDAETRRPERISVRAGDQLALTVEARAFHEVEIPSFGLLEPAEAGAPARFDLLIERPGSFLVRLGDRGRAIARIDARAGSRLSRSTRSGESKARDRESRGSREA